MIIQIDETLMSSDIFDVKFCCDLGACKGICCVEGNSGAPVEIDEVETLETEYEAFKPYMKAEGIKAVESQGVVVIDPDGDLTTPLINDAECAYSIQKNGTTFCAIEKAYLDRKTTFKKPISCHLYPIRLSTFSNGTTAMNYHRWDVCNCALNLGEKLGIPVYKMLKEPIIRKFGEEFYNAMQQMEVQLKNESKI